MAKGIPGKGGKQRKVTPAEIDEWKQLRKSGLSIAEVAAKVGRNVTTVALKTGKPGSTPPKTSPEQISQARSMRAKGSTLEEIVAATGIGHSAAHRYVKDISKPRTEASISASVTKHERQRRRLLIDEKTNTTNYAVNDEDTPSEYLPDKLPATAEGFDVSGLFPDPALLIEANGVCRRWEADKATGRVMFGVPVDVLKSLIILSTEFQPWSGEWWLSNRHRWGDIRRFSSIGTEAISERVGVSSASISRYEKATRTPTKGDTERMRMAYSSALEQRVHQLELSLCFHDYSAAFDLDDEDELDWDDALRWITAVGDNLENGDEEITVKHLPSLAHVRSLQPAPSYRDEDQMLFGYLGYGDTLKDEEVGAA